MRVRVSRAGWWSVALAGRAALVVAAAATILLLSHTVAIAANNAGTQFQQQEDALGGQFTWARLVDEHESAAEQSVLPPVHEEDFNFAAIETAHAIDTESEGEADIAVDTQVELESESEVDADSDSDSEVTAEADTETEESLQSEEKPFPAMLDEDESMSILLELSDHMDVSSILEHKHHQQMFQSNPKSKSKSISEASNTKKGSRGSAASRLTKDVQASKFARFTSKQKRKYATPKEAANAFQVFSKNREDIVALNDQVAPNRPAVFKSTGPFADKATGEFKKTRTTAKIQLGRAKGKAVRIKRRKGVKERNAKKSSTSTVGSGRSAGFSGQTAGQSGKTGGKSGKAGGQSGKTGGKSGKAGGQSGKTGGDAGGKAKKSGKTGGAAGGKAKKSGKTGGDAGGNAKKSGKTGGDAGGNAKKSGKTGGDAGGNAKKSGKTGGDAGKDAKKSGKTGGNSGTNAKKSGKTGGTKGNRKDKNGIVLQPNDIALPPSKKGKKEKESNKLSSDIGVTVESIRASMKAAGVTDAEINAAFAQMKGEYKKGGDIGMDLFGYQKGTCGSCWAHAAGDALTRLWKKQQKWISNELISVQQILDCVRTSVSNGCNGGSPMDAIDYLTNNPVALMNEYPLKATTGQCKPAPFGGRPNYKAAFGWEMSVPPCEEKGDCKGQAAYEHLLLKWLKGNSLTPIVYVDASQWQHYSGGILPLSACSSTTAKGNHIVQIVGYGTDSATGIPYWVIRNSWSRSWGEDGQIRIPFGVNACGVMNFCLSVSDPENDLVNNFDPIWSAENVVTNQMFDVKTRELHSSTEVEKGMSKSEILARLQIKSQEVDSQGNAEGSQLMQQRIEDFKKSTGAMANRLNENVAESRKKRDKQIAEKRKIVSKKDAVAEKMQLGEKLSTPEEKKLAKQVQVDRANAIRNKKGEYWQSIAARWIQDTNWARFQAGLPTWTEMEKAARAQLIIDQMRKIDQRVASQFRNEDHDSLRYRTTIMNAFFTDPTILKIRNDQVPGRDVLKLQQEQSQLLAKFDNVQSNSQYGGGPTPVDLQQLKATSFTYSPEATFPNSMPTGSSAVRNGPAFPLPTTNGQTSNTSSK